MGRRRSNSSSATLNLRPGEVLCRSASLEDLVRLSDGVTDVQIVRLGEEPSAAMRHVAECLRDIGRPDLPFSVTHCALSEACDAALTGGSHVLAGQMTGSTALLLAFAPASIRSCTALLQHRTA